MLHFLIVLILFAQAKCAVHMNIPELNRDVNINETRSHLIHARVQRLCRNRDRICASGDSVVCAVRYVNGEPFYKQFNNSCVLFMSNMCEYPGEEFNIASGTVCSEYLKSRRHGILPNIGNFTKSNATDSQATNKPKQNLRTPSTLSTLYDIDTSFDFHICPMSCPDTYEPVCVCVNRNFGLYFKFFTFKNHCEADRYYCKHWEEFSPPPDENEKIQSSPLGWSYCGSSKYLMFTRFAEATASLGHYGWLNGDYKYTHIMEPHEKKPGYG